ncbi:amidohydrolase [Methylococcus sp. EFPC2]|uniref:amidohydrolase family protein n=1 Tax=Methylococcus sp. EFPC2 TaxID=2812648 RepID=UPI001967D828|nr:amidohydrolase [Methylococcus sp. EFPC2]QSA96010.1 amidohydrolase [Methylococcus sp. EFPC2]
MKTRPCVWMALTKKWPIAAVAIVTAVLPPGAANADGKEHRAEPPRPLILRADRVFDGVDLHEDYAVKIVGDKVAAIGPASTLRSRGARVRDLGDATLLPGFIELHGHVAYQNVPRDIILRHGVTTVRDVGGPLLPLSGGHGRLRLVTAGPIITGPGGYPGPVFTGDVSAPVDSPETAQALVDDLVAGGANIIKIGLEPGGEEGAPWTTGHTPSIEPPWPMPSPAVVRAVVVEAHRLGREVTAHVGEEQGLQLAVDAGVDEIAHIPCDPVSHDLLHQAVHQGIRFLSTVDTFSHCRGTHENLHGLVHLGAKIHYAAEIAHTEIPWGIDAGELHALLHANMAVDPDPSHIFGHVLNLFRSATSEAGKVLALGPEGGLDKLGTLVPGAPADIIAVSGNAFMAFKPLEYPSLVISGGKTVVDQLAD